MDTDAISKKIVIVEDNTSLADIYKTRLELIGYKCFVAYDGEAALAMIQRELPSLVLLDLMIPKIAGDMVLERMRSTDWGKNIKVYIISNLNEVDAPAGLRDKGIVGYAVKANLSNDQLDRLVDSILKPSTQTEDVSALENKTPNEPVVTYSNVLPVTPPPTSPVASPATAPQQPSSPPTTP